MTQLSFTYSAKTPRLPRPEVVKMSSDAAERHNKQLQDIYPNWKFDKIG